LGGVDRLAGVEVALPLQVLLEALPDPRAEAPERLALQRRQHLAGVAAVGAAEVVDGVQEDVADQAALDERGPVEGATAPDAGEPERDLERAGPRPDPEEETVVDQPAPAVVREGAEGA